MKPGTVILYHSIQTFSHVYVTVFGKNGLNEICVGPFLSATHFETFKSIQMHSQCILKRLQCPPTEIENIPYHWKIISKHSENVYKRWEASLIMIIFPCVRIHPRNIPTGLSRVVFGHVVLQLTRIRRTLFHKNKSTEKNGSGIDPRNRVVIFFDFARQNKRSTKEWTEFKIRGRKCHVHYSFLSQWVLCVLIVIISCLKFPPKWKRKGYAIQV